MRIAFEPLASEARQTLVRCLFSQAPPPRVSEDVTEPIPPIPAPPIHSNGNGHAVVADLKPSPRCVADLDTAPALNGFHAPSISERARSGVAAANEPPLRPSPVPLPGLPPGKNLPTSAPYGREDGNAQAAADLEGLSRLVVDEAISIGLQLPFFAIYPRNHRRPRWPDPWTCKMVSHHGIHLILQCPGALYRSTDSPGVEILREGDQSRGIPSPGLRQSRTGPGGSAARCKPPGPRIACCPRRWRLIGSAVSPVMHDLNNLLTPIVGFSDDLRQREDILDDVLGKTWKSSTRRRKRSSRRSASCKAYQRRFILVTRWTCTKRSATSRISGILD